METAAPGADLIASRKPKARWRRWMVRLGAVIVVIGLVAGIASAGFGVVVDFSPTPADIHVFGQVYSREYPWCVESADLGYGRFSMASIKTALGPSSQPTVVHLSGVPLAWLGFADAGAAGDTVPSIVFLQTGTDDYQPYQEMFVPDQDSCVPVSSASR